MFEPACVGDDERRETRQTLAYEPDRARPPARTAAARARGVLVPWRTGIGRLTGPGRLVRRRRHPPGAMRILLATTFLNCLSGSELYLFDLARGLRRRGHDVTCWVEELAPSATLPRLLELDGIAVTETLPSEAAVDAVVFQLKETFPIWRERFLGVPRLAICHGPKLPAEIAPADLPRTVHLALTREGFVALTRRGYPNVHYVGYGIDLGRFSSARSLPARPARAVIHSKYCDRDIVRGACRRLGIEVVELGVGSWQPGFASDHFSGIVEVRPDGAVVDHDPRTAAFHVERVLAGADVVFAMGRSAVEAMALGCACVVFGYGDVGDGLVTPERLERFAGVNFSGRALGRRFDEDALVAELSRYSPRQGVANREFARRHYDLERALDRIERLMRADPRRDLAGVT